MTPAPILSPPPAYTLWTNLDWHLPGPLPAVSIPDTQNKVSTSSQYERLPSCGINSHWLGCAITENHRRTIGCGSGCCHRSNGCGYLAGAPEKEGGDGGRFAHFTISNNLLTVAGAESRIIPPPSRRACAIPASVHYSCISATVPGGDATRRRDQRRASPERIHAGGDAPSHGLWLRPKSWTADDSFAWWGNAANWVEKRNRRLATMKRPFWERRHSMHRNHRRCIKISNLVDNRD